MLHILSDIIVGGNWGKMSNIDYEKLYWKEVEENIQLQEKIEKLEWQLHLAEIKIKNLRLCGKH